MKKILFLHTGRIGDMILMTGFFDQLKKAHPDYTLDVIAGPSNAVVLKNNPAIRRVLPLVKSPSGLIRFISHLRSQHYDLYLDPKDHYSGEGYWIAKAVRASLKVGYKKGNNSPFQYSNVEGLDPNKVLHYAELPYQAAKQAGITFPTPTIRPKLYPNEQNQKRVEAYLAEQGIQAEYVVLNLSASQPIKEWPISHWADLLQRQPSKRPIVICTPPSAVSTARELSTQLKQFAGVFSSADLLDATELIRRSSGLLSPDTSLIHVAAAFDRPIFGLYSGLDHFYQKFSPLSSTQVVVKGDADKSGIQTIRVQQAIEPLRLFWGLL
jgi:heptosyltransferase-2